MPGALACAWVMPAFQCSSNSLGGEPAVREHDRVAVLAQALLDGNLRRGRRRGARGSGRQRRRGWTARARASAWAVAAAAVVAVAWAIGGDASGRVAGGSSP